MPALRDLAQPRERRHVGAQAQQHVHPAAAAFERCAVVRRAQEHQLRQRRQPGVALALRRGGRRCARPARPCCGRRSPTRPPAPASAPPAVPAVRRTRARSPTHGGRCCSAGTAACSPARAPARGHGRDRARVHCRSLMHRPCTSTSSLRPACGDDASPGGALQVERWPSAVRSAMRMASGLPVAARWSPHTPFSAATKASRCGVPASRAGGVDPSTPMAASTPRPDDTCGAAHRAVDRTGDAPGAAGRCRREHAHARGDGVMHGFDQIGQADGAVHTQPVQAAQVGWAQAQGGQIDGGSGVHASLPFEWRTDGLCVLPGGCRKRPIRGASRSKPAGAARPQPSGARRPAKMVRTSYGSAAPIE